MRSKTPALLIGIALATTVAVFTRPMWARHGSSRDRTEIEELLARRNAGLGTPVDPEEAARYRPDDPELFIPREDALTLLLGNTRAQQWDPITYFAAKPNFTLEADWPEHMGGRWTFRTNSAGLREDDEIAADVDVRILVTGDSHVDGMCNNSESYPNLLEAALSRDNSAQTVEVVNLGDRGYSFFNYLGVAEKYSGLGAKLFVVTVYGGNDFLEVLLPARYFAREAAPPRSDLQREQASKAESVSFSAWVQGVASVAWFRDHPEEIDRSLSLSIDCVKRIRRVCESHGTTLLVVYLPSALEIESGRMHERIESATSAAGLDDSALLQHAEIGRRFLRRVHAEGIETFDTSPALLASDHAMFWFRDMHLSVAGHQVVANAVKHCVARLCALQD
jgi:hypothetical protein